MANIGDIAGDVAHSATAKLIGVEAATYSTGCTSYQNAYRN